MEAKYFWKLDQRSLAALLLTALAIAVFALGCFVSYQKLRDEHRAGNREEAQRMLLAFDAHSMRLFDYADSYLRAIRAFHAEHGDGEKWQRFVREIQAPHAELFTGIVTLIDRDGWVVYQSETSRDKLKGYGNMSGLDHYQYFISHPGDSLFVGGTRLGKITGKLQFRLARPLLRDGVFDGLVVITLLPEHITDFYRSLNLGQHSTVAMITEETKLIARYPPVPPEMYDRVLFDQKKISEINLASEPGGRLIGFVSPIDHIRRDAYYKKLAGYPVALVVNISEQDLDDAIAGTRHNLILLALAFALFALVVCTQALHLIGRNRRLVCAEAASSVSMRQAQASEARLQAVFDASPDAMMICDEQGVISMANRQVERLYGFPAEELVGQSTSVLLPERFRAGYQAFRAQLLDDSSLYGVTVTAARKDGREFEVEVIVSRIQTDQGQFIAAVLRDVTERKQAEDSLRDSTNRLKEAQRIAQLGSWMLDPSSGKLIWSDEIFRIFEIDPARFGATYEAFLNAIHPEDRDKVNRAYSESLANRTPYEITHRLLMSDGRIKWVQERGTSEFDAAGNALRSCGTVQDITERRLSEEQLRIASTAFESQEGMMITDANHVILRVNHAFTEITGYTAEEIVGQKPSLLRSDRHDDEFFRRMWETIDRTGGWQGEIWDRRKNGEVYPKWLTITAVKDTDGVVTHYIGTHFDITERKRAEEKINELAFFDQLTGLPNRTLLLDRLKQVMAASSRGNSHGALLFIDLDNFKTLNDTLGHDIGDDLLRQVAERLRLCVREGDTVSRLGGDEFVVVMAGFSPDEADAAAAVETVAEKVLNALNQPYRLGEVAHQCSASIGVTLFRGDLVTMDVLMKQADLAMYKSKTAGRNLVHFFDPSLEASVKERAAMDKDLRRAIEEQQFLLHYQAQVNGDGRLTGVEALVRWRHPERGMVSPANFISLAEETGLILPLGNWVLRTACEQLVAWSTRSEFAHLTVAVNVSALQFHQANFVGQVLKVLNSTGANPQRLKLELTESLLVENVEGIIEKMNELKTKGVGFSLDDFGTGYSSLSYLKRLPLDQLKIDRSFVRDVLSDPNDAAIAKTIVALGQSLGLAVIAEGVETESQRDFLASNGCHAYQGYLFSRPLPIEAFEQYLLNSVKSIPS